VVIGHISGVDPGICAVGIDNLKASRQVVRHLVGLGRRNLASLWPYGEYVLLSKGRAEGYLEALTTLASPTMPICGVSYFCGPELTSARGYWMTHRILKDQPALDALIVGTDSMVRGAIYAIQESGRRVPEDVSVVTFDDKPINIIESPSITALRIPFLEIYRQATQLLVDLIQGRITEPQHIELEPELIIRESCGGELPK
jgi:DNA-binding LacI/PurR family transcriptional regulator